MADAEVAVVAAEGSGTAAEGSGMVVVVAPWAVWQILSSVALAEAARPCAHRIAEASGMVLRHGRDVHPTWVVSYTGTMSNKGSGVLSTRAKSKEDFDNY